MLFRSSIKMVHNRNLIMIARNQRCSTLRILCSNPFFRGCEQLPVKLDDHSEVVPLLPIPNRTVKRLSADDSAGSRVKVGHCQAINKRAPVERRGLFSFQQLRGEISFNALLARKQLKAYCAFSLTNCCQEFCRSAH